MGEKKHGLRRVAGYFVNHRLLNWMPDKPYLQIFYYAEFGKFIDFKNPKTFNEKLNWLKLYYRRPDLITLVDKYEVKKYIADKIGEQYVIPTLGVWDKFEDINFNELPNQFVLKCTHDSGGLVVCKDKSKLDLKKAKDQETGELRDYKFFCFNGEPKLMFVATERGVKNTKFDFYDMQFNHMNIVQHYPNSVSAIKKPEHFEKMLELAKKLREGFPHVRVDFYEANGQVYFGEMTFYHFGAIVPFETKEWDKKIGDWLVLPEKIS